MTIRYTISRARRPGLMLMLAALALMPGRASAESAVSSNLVTRETERAIERGLEWLAQDQAEDGGWHSKGNVVGVSSLALIAFMCQAHFPSEGDYGPVLERGLDFLLKANKEGLQGFMGTQMYSHGLATLALSEFWGHSDRDDEIRDALKDGVDIILRSQAPIGGWRYNPEPSGADVSVTAMQLVALASARSAGILVPDETIEKAIEYVKMCHDPTEGGFSYFAGGNISGWQRTGAAIVSLMLAGEHDAKEAREGFKYLLSQPDDIFDPSNLVHYDYGQYYGVIANYLEGEDHLERWYPKIRKWLLESQHKDGGWKDPYSTAMRVIVLSIPKGFVPAYQR
ncbi:MAG: prenyltransferase/squalene oxidase repeat-containing protein [Planctomycetota bacterium]